MYVSLEPCCHQGKTPPCSQALIDAKLFCVVVATADPSVKVAGKGLDQLRSAGIEVILGPCAEKARRLNAPFFKLHRKGRPFVMLKWAQSIDGKIATPPGQSPWISNEKSQRFAHQLRQQSQAILVGIGTALADDPLLTPRPAPPGRLPLRIVLDSCLRLSLDSQLVRTVGQAPLMIATTESAAQEKSDLVGAFAKTGAEVCPVYPGPGPIDLNCLLDLLGQRRVSTLMVEGGAQVLSQFIDQQLADEVCIFVSPRTIEDSHVLSPIGPEEPDRIPEALKLSNVTTCRFDEDLFIRGDLPALDYLHE